MSALTVWSEAAVAVREPLATTFVNALSLATSQLDLGVRAEPGAGHGLGGGRHPGPQQDAVRERVPEATPCRKAGASVAAPAGSAAASGPARTAVAAAALTTVRRRGEGS